MPERFRPVIALLAIVGLGVAWTKPAQADRLGKPQLGVDLDWAVVADSDSAEGFGTALRLGYQLDLAGLTLIPELGGHYMSFSDADTKLYRGIVGARARFGTILQPGAYAHFGLARADTDRLLDPSWTASTMDGGLSLDLTPIPVLEIGGHAGYYVVTGKDDADAFKWWAAGLHATIVF